MSESGVKRQKFTISQLIKAEDLDGLTDFDARAMIETAWASNFGDVYKAITSGVGGVVGGFMVTAQVATNNVQVGPGLALIPATQDNPSTDSPMVWIQTDDTETIDLTGLIDATFPRLVTIEIAADLGVVFETKVRSSIDPVTGAYSPEPFDVVVGGRPTYFATAGVASLSPVVAAGTPGRIPLAVVKLPSGLPGYTDGFSPVLMCRPLLAAMGSRMTPRDYVRGGGCAVGEENGGVIVNLTDIFISKLSTALLGVEVDVMGRIQFASFGRSKDTVPLAVLFGTAQPVYGYAGNPPWVADYGDIAPREAWQRNPNAVAFADPYNVVGGQGFTFVSLSTESIDPGTTLRNAIVFWDVDGPSGLARGVFANAPLQVTDARGPHPDTVAGTPITLDAAIDPSWGATQEVTDTVYLGTVSSLGVSGGGANDFMAQASTGARIIAIDAVDFAGGFAATRRPAVEFTTTATAAIYPGRFPGMLVADDEILPATAEDVELYYRFAAGNGPGDASFTLFPDVGFGRPEIALIALSGVTSKIDTATALDYESAGVTEMKRSTSGTINKALVIGVGTSLIVLLSGYTDAILAAR